MQSGSEKTLKEVLEEQGREWEKKGLKLNYLGSDIIACAVLEKLGLLSNEYVSTLRLDFQWVEEGAFGRHDPFIVEDAGSSKIQVISDDTYGLANEGDFFNYDAKFCYIQFMNNRKFTDVRLNSKIQEVITRLSPRVKQINLYGDFPYFGVGEHPSWVGYYCGTGWVYDRNATEKKENGITCRFSASFIEEALQESSLVRAMDDKYVKYLDKNEREKLIGSIELYFNLRTDRPSVNAVKDLASQSATKIRDIVLAIENDLTSKLEKFSTRLSELELEKKDSIEQLAMVSINNAIKKSLDVGNPKEYFEEPNVKKQLEEDLAILQKGSWDKTVQNALTICLAVLAVPIFGLGVWLLLNNKDKRGSYGLFWTEGDKQSAEEAVHIAKHLRD